MVCKECNAIVDELIPIDPRGTKERRWICESCLKQRPYIFAKYLYRRGKRTSLKLSLVIWCNKFCMEIEDAINKIRR